jgi:hypothetical protein
MKMLTEQIPARATLDATKATTNMLDEALNLTNSIEGNNAVHTHEAKTPQTMSRVSSSEEQKLLFFTNTDRS